MKELTITYFSGHSGCEWPRYNLGLSAHTFPNMPHCVSPTNPSTTELNEQKSLSLEIRIIINTYLYYRCKSRNRHIYRREGWISHMNWAYISCAELLPLLHASSSFFKILQWKHRILTSGPPERKSPYSVLSKVKDHMQLSSEQDENQSPPKIFSHLPEIKTPS